MFNDRFRGRDFITILDYTREEVEAILDFADELKAKHKRGHPHKYLESKTLFMIFYNQSLRTRNSFEAGMTQLGGHAHFLDPDKIYMPALEGDVSFPTSLPNFFSNSFLVFILAFLLITKSSMTFNRF